MVVVLPGWPFCGLGTGSMPAGFAVPPTQLARACGLPMWSVDAELGARGAMLGSVAPLLVFPGGSWRENQPASQVATSLGALACLVRANPPESVMDGATTLLLLLGAGT